MAKKILQFEDVDFDTLCMYGGADAVATAAVTAARLSDPALSNRLTGLAAALTSLVQTPDSEVARSQALAALVGEG